MAGDWIKLETATPDKPEVHRLADLLGVTADDALGKLARFWIWVDRNVRNGQVTHVYARPLESMMHCPGFVGAMVDVGWLSLNEKTGQVTIPNHERHNGNTAKTRALTNKRQHEYRNAHRNAPSNASVTQTASPEKRREEKNKKEPRLPIGTDVDNSVSKSKPIERDPETNLRSNETLEEQRKRIKAMASKVLKAMP